MKEFNSYCDMNLRSYCPALHHGFVCKRKQATIHGVPSDQILQMGDIVFTLRMVTHSHYLVFITYIKVVVVVRYLHVDFCVSKCVCFHVMTFNKEDSASFKR